MTLILIVAVAIGVFIFVKNNPKKTAKIDAAAKDIINKTKDAVKND